MPALHTISTSFNGGELSPLLDSRTDMEGYNKCCRVMENFIPRPHGGAFKRPGMQYLGRAKFDGTTRLHGFKRSTDTNYILEFGLGYIRVWKGGVDAGAVGLPSASTFTAIAWSNALSFGVGGFTVRNDVTYICTSPVSSGTAATTEPGAGSDWPSYWSVFYFEIGEYRSDGTDVYRCDVRHSPSDSFSDDISAGYWSLVDSQVEIPSPYLDTDVFGLQFCQLNDILFIAHPNYPPQRLVRRSETDWILEYVPFDFAPTLDVNESRTSVQVQFNGIPPFGLPWVTATAYAAGDRVHGVGAGVVGRVYECILGHTSSAAGAGGNEPGIGATWTTNWTLISSTGYSVGNRVTAVDVGGSANPYNGQVFTCHTAYNPGTTANDEPGLGSAWTSYWNEGTSSVKIADWAGNVSYIQGAKVRVGKAIYECIRNHKSVAPGKPVRPGGSFEEGNKPGVSKGWVRYWRVSSADTDLSGLGFSLFATDPIFDISDVETVWLLEVGTGGIFEQITTPSAGATNTSANNPLFIQGGYIVTSTWNSDDAMLGTISIEESLDGVVWNTVRQFNQLNKKDGNISYTGEAPTVGAWYRISAKATDTPTAPSKIKIEATNSVLKLPFKITHFATETEVLGYYIMPGNQLPPALAVGASTSLWRRPAFSLRDGYPRAVAFHDSRLWWAGTANYPARLWASHTEDYYTYLTGALDTDGLDLTLAAVEANAIQWVTSFNRALVIGTTGDEWTLDSGETDEALKPFNLRARRRTRYGSNGVPPQLTGDSLLWAGRNSRSIYEFAYEFQRDAYTAPDMVVLAEHILDKDVTQMAFQAATDPILWCVRSDGQLAGMSYNREQKVVAWHRHFTGNRDPFMGSVIEGGTVPDRIRSVAVIYGDVCDEVWFVVDRQVGGEFGGTKTYIERFEPYLMAFAMGASESVLDANDSRWKYLDSHITISTPGGLTHLIERFVFFTKPDGEVSELEYPVFESGNIPLAMNVTRTYGLPIRAMIVLPRFEFMLNTGTTQGRKLRFNRLIARVWKSQSGAWMTIDDDTGSDLPLFGPRYYETANGSFDFSGVKPSVSVYFPARNEDSEHFITFTGQLPEEHLNTTPGDNPQVLILSRDGKPFNILALILKLEISGE